MAITLDKITNKRIVREIEFIKAKKVSCLMYRLNKEKTERIRADRQRDSTKVI